MEHSSGKRKRTQNTSSAQYELYLDMLENDLHRSSTIDTVEDNYMDVKWQELTTKLNSIARGPALPEDRWKKRFKDWKNATRMKYRRMKQSQIRGSSIRTRITLTPLEQRGLELWGAETRTSLTQCIGDSTEVKRELRDSTEENEICFVRTDEVETTMEDINKWDSDQYSHVPSASCSSNDSSLNESKESICTCDNSEENIKLKKSDCQCNSMKEFSDTFSQFMKVYETVNKVKNNLKNRKLEFEIAKFKFQNPSFEFNDDNEND